jgi:hypothetical protein
MTQKGDKGSSGTNNGGTNTEDKIKPSSNKPVVDDAGSQPDADKDNEPEGDDPDEFRAPVVVEAFKTPNVSTTPVMAERHQAAAGTRRAGTGTSGREGQHGSMPQGSQQGGGLPGVNSVRIAGGPLPEDGGPDELRTPTASQSGAIAVGSTDHAALFPGVGDEGKEAPDRPIGPRFLRGTIAVGSTDQTASSSTIGDDGSKVIPDIRGPIPTP